MFENPLQRKLHQIPAFRPAVALLYEHMFRSVTSKFAGRVSDLIDDMLIGDYDYVVVGEHTYADVDFERRCASDGLVASVPQRRPGAVQAADVPCASPLRTAAACGPPATAGARLRGPR